MKIPAQILNKWKSLYDRGDIVEIAEQSKIEGRTISKALKGEGSAKTISAIKEFYSKKASLLKSA